MNDFRGKRVVVLGLGRFGGGIAVSRWLVEQGARVLVADQAQADKLGESVAQLAGLPIEYRLGEQNESDFVSADLVVTSPAVAPTSPLLLAARRAGVPITTEICLFAARCPARVVAVTGTKGKSTTTAMLGRMLARRYRTHVGGNIGKSLLFDLPSIGRDDLVVLELSSYMLHYLGDERWAPHVAVVTMVAEDHLDWHGGVEAYHEAKKNIVRFQSATDIAVLFEDAAPTRSFAQVTRARVVFYPRQPMRELSLRIPGRHNQFNAQGALTAAMELGVSFDDAQAAVADFAGLPHRLELVAESSAGDGAGDRAGDGAGRSAPVRWFNDSIATIPTAAAAALQAFEPRRVVHIVGGYDKHLPIDEMCAALARHAKAVLCIGATGPMVAAGVTAAAAGAGEPRVEVCGDLANAVSRARALAGPGDVVLLSPGYASYDQFDNFEKRGEAFAALARRAT